jgi:hypothetical protein
MWAKKCYVRDICAAIGPGASRNAVIGKAHRLGLGTKRDEWKRLRAEARDARLKAKAQARALALAQASDPTLKALTRDKRASILDDLAIQGEVRATLEQMTKRSRLRFMLKSHPKCTWFGCDSPPYERGKPYCRDHRHAVMVQPTGVIYAGSGLSR